MIEDKLISAMVFVCNKNTVVLGWGAFRKTADAERPEASESQRKFDYLPLGYRAHFNLCN